MKKAIRISVSTLLILALSLCMAACAGNAPGAGQDQSSNPESTASSAASTVSGNTATADAVTISVFTPTGDGWSENKGFQAAMEKVAEEMPNVSVELSLPAGTGEEKMAIMIATDDLSDAVFFHNRPYWLTVWNASINFTEMDDPEILSLFSDSILNLCKVDGKLYGVPYGVAAATGIMYNRDIFEELGLSVPATWDEFLSVCESIKSAGYVPFALGGKDSWSMQPTIFDKLGAYMHQHPEYIADINANKSKFTDTSLMEDTLKEMKVLVDKGYVQDGYLATSYSEAVVMFGTGEAAMFEMSAEYTGPVLDSDYPDVDFGLFPMPTNIAFPAVITTNGFPGLMVNKNGKYVEETTAWVKAMSSLDNFKLFYSLFKGIPIVNGVEMDSDFGIFVDAKKYIDEGLYAGNFKDLYIVASIGPWENWIQGMLDDQMTPADVVQKVQDEFETNAVANKVPGF